VAVLDVAAGLADAGIASEPVARAYDLDFIPLAAEHFPTWSSRRDKSVRAKYRGC
jgi:molybdate-binding protein